MSLDITISCLCKAHTFTESVPRDNLPLSGTYCHCNSCRHVTGGMYTQGYLWYGPEEEIIKSDLKRYAISENLILFFCGTCSTPLFGKAGKYICIPDGVLPNISEADLVRTKDHIFVEDTLDGGASNYMQTGNSDGLPIPRWNGYRQTKADPDWPSNDELKSLKTKGDHIPFRCHCKGVDLLLERPTVTYADPKKELPRFVDPQSKKLVVSFDVCDSCRLSSGNSIWYWTFSNLSQISDPSGKPFPTTVQALKAAADKGDLGTLGYYASSEDVQRYFCTTCSASVFYAVDELPERVDIGVGLFDAPEGSRGDSFLLWEYGSIGWAEDVKGGWREAVVASVRQESDAWREKRGIEKSWRRKKDSHW